VRVFRKSSCFEERIVVVLYVLGVYCFFAGFGLGLAWFWEVGTGLFEEGGFWGEQRKERRDFGVEPRDLR
jgi:hypothetical protein